MAGKLVQLKTLLRSESFWTIFALKLRFLEEQKVKLKTLNRNAIEFGSLNEQLFYQVDDEMLLKLGFLCKALAAGLAFKLLLLEFGKGDFQMNKMANVNQLKRQDHEKIQTTWPPRWVKACLLSSSLRANLFKQSSH